MRGETNWFNQIKLMPVKKVLRRVNQYSKQMRDLSDEQLQQLTTSYRLRLESGETEKDILAEALATIREAARRVIGQYAYDVQVMGAIALHRGMIAEMKTGEGKTLTATLALYLNGLSKKGAMLVTSNEFLARRDGQEMGKVLAWMDLSVEIGVPDNPNVPLKPYQKQKIYAADVVYTTHSALGFDYLLDNLATSLSDKFFRSYDFIIVDEVDEVLLDSARTPLVISGAPRVQSNLMIMAHQFVQTLKVEEEEYEIDYDQQKVWLTEKGMNQAEHFFRKKNFYTTSNFELIRHIQLALKAEVLFKLSDHYVIEAEEVRLIDSNTGRQLIGTKLQGGLHQAIEAKEGIKLTPMNRATGSITYQHLFKKFNRLAGMSGTAITSLKEFREVYAMEVIIIPTNRPMIREDLPHQIFLTQEEKAVHILDKVKKIHETGQPVLIATESIALSQYYSQCLLEEGLSHNLLNAHHTANEAAMIQEAGRLNAITVATAIAGRGTDIKLDEASRDLGGLYVLGTDMMSNIRIERQLRGRSGRQGDPGKSQFYISMDEELIQKWLKNGMKKQLDRYRKKNKILKQGSRAYRECKAMIDYCQKYSEERQEYARKMTLEFDESLNIQREIIYELRRHILTNPIELEQLMHQVIEGEVDRFVAGDKLSRQAVIQFISTHISYKDTQTLQRKFTHSQQVKPFLMAMVSKEIAQKKDSLGVHWQMFLTMAILKAVDECWIDQVDYLQQLKTMVSHRQSAQKNTIMEYHKESLEAFQFMKQKIHQQLMDNVLLSSVYINELQLDIFFA